MNHIDLSTYKPLYLNTARDHILNLKKNLEILKKNATDKNAVYEVFRLFHSLKSQNFFMGFQKTALLSKIFEDLFRSINDGKKDISAAILSEVNDVINKIEYSLNNIEKNNAEVDLSEDIIIFQSKLDSIVIPTKSRIQTGSPISTSPIGFDGRGKSGIT